MAKRSFAILWGTIVATFLTGITLADQPAFSDPVKVKSHTYSNYELTAVIPDRFGYLLAQFSHYFNYYRTEYYSRFNRLEETGHIGCYLEDFYAIKFEWHDCYVEAETKALRDAWFAADGSYYKLFYTYQYDKSSCYSDSSSSALKLQKNEELPIDLESGSSSCSGPKCGYYTREPYFINIRSDGHMITSKDFGKGTTTTLTNTCFNEDFTITNIGPVFKSDDLVSVNFTNAGICFSRDSGTTIESQIIYEFSEEKYLYPKFAAQKDDIRIILYYDYVLEGLFLFESDGLTSKIIQYSETFQNSNDNTNKYHGWFSSDGGLHILPYRDWSNDFFQLLYRSPTGDWKVTNVSLNWNFNYINNYNFAKVSNDKPQIVILASKTDSFDDGVYYLYFENGEWNLIEIAPPIDGVEYSNCYVGATSDYDILVSYYQEGTGENDGVYIRTVPDTLPPQEISTGWMIHDINTECTYN